MSGDDDLISLGLTFALLSLLSIGGVVTILPEMHRAVIEVNGWMSRETFATLGSLQLPVTEYSKAKIWPSGFFSTLLAIAAVSFSSSAAPRQDSMVSGKSSSAPCLMHAVVCLAAADAIDDSA